MNETTAYGLTMRWCLVKSAPYGKYVIHGYIGNEQRMGHGFNYRKPSRERCERAVCARLYDISRDLRSEDRPASPVCVCGIQDCPIHGVPSEFWGAK